MKITTSLIAITLAITFLISATHPPTARAQDLPPHVVELDAKLSHLRLPIEQPQEVFATFDLEALQAEIQSEDRPAMNLALVIDRSGSMQGPRIAQARQAALHLVESLTPADRLALITYGDQHTLVFDSTPAEAANKPAMRQSIASIGIQGWTNLSAGYEAAVEIVSQHHQEESINRVILLSDGQVNRGITDLPTLKRMSRLAFDRGISTSTIGFGLDYNEQLMTGMAVEGSGNYYFADDGDDLRHLVAQEVTGMSATVANRIEVHLDPGPGVEIIDIFGFTFRRQDAKVIVPLAEMAARDRRSIVAQLSVVAPPHQDFQVLAIRANYRDTVNDQHRYRRQVLTASATASASEVTRFIDRDVMARVEEVRMARTMDRAMQAYGSGDRDGAKALLDAETRRSQTLRQELQIESNELAEMDDTFESLNSTVQQAPPASAEGRRARMKSSARSFGAQQGR